ncbi:MAG: phosphoribosyltransferase [Candidatus Pacearchaeota archaeon]|jgi:hypoxanthine phosphoribosyltransferase
MAQNLTLIPREIEELEGALKTLNLNGGSDDEKRSVATKLADLQFKDGDWYGAVHNYVAYGCEGREDRIREAAARYNNWLSRGQAFAYLKDLGNLVPILEDLRASSDSCLNELISRFIGSRVVSRFGDEEKRWISDRGFDGQKPGFVDRSLVMAHSIARNYDLGIGIAKGGLPLAYMFNLFGLDIRVVESHPRYNGRMRKIPTFKAHDDISDIRGKRILVLENDTLSGKTLERVGSELVRYNPATIDVAFIYDPINPRTMGNGTRVDVIPRRIYRETYFPKDFSYNSLGEAVKELERRLDG